MKRAVSLLVSLVLLLGMPSGCGQSGDTPAAPEPEPVELAEPSELPAARMLAEAVLPASGKEEELEVEGLNRDTDADRLGAYIEAVCGLTADRWEDAAVIRGTGASAFEIVVLRLGDEDAAAGLETVLADYLTAREGAFTGYAPAEAEMAANGLVRRMERTVGLFICPDPEGAAAAFSAAYHGEALPAPVEAEPVQSFAVSAAMQPLADALAEICRSEIDEIIAAGGMVASAATKTKGFPEMVEQAYGIAPEQWTDGFAVQSLLSNVSLFELVVFRATDQDAAEQCMDALWEYKDSVQEQFCTVLTVDDSIVRNVSDEQADAYSYVGGARMIQIGEYIGLFICRDAEEVGKAFLRAQDSIQNTEPSETPGRQDPDPDYPDRIRFVPPNEEDMSIYDTSAILAAWEVRDPSGLGGDDREIYDAAEAVLAEIMREGMTDLEKEIAAYGWLVDNVDYDWTHQDALAETDRRSYGPYGGLVNRAAVCLGYAVSFQLLMDMGGVECITVVGAAFNSTGDHAWNMVKLDGEWYCVDVTWDANGREQLGADYVWRYFNVTSDEMGKNHQWDYANTPEAAAEDRGGAMIGQ